ncbi:MAG: tRNA (adenosine(37)-N6)-threonylcarbamoyltransferase complex transferase subunit TsaD, partial [bacterium]|nr:tRNA (adenosine(37)-N6)-threonylcarbamoyltransferase complex transferase subunit TsaD [bacterium]
FPMIAKREHTKNIDPLYNIALKEAGLLDANGKISQENKIDLITVTEGPGLEPALWVGITFAESLGGIWDSPIIPVNHMEGHIVTSLISKENSEENKEDSEENSENLFIKKISYPALALLISGGHTELVKINKLGEYEILGSTRDDAVGEAFDKVARLLGMTYPGGPEISKYAEVRVLEKGNIPPLYPLPRPMLHSKDLDFSFSGLKTFVLYTLKKIPKITEDDKKEIAYEFQNAVIEVLLAKTLEAGQKIGVKDLIIGGGVTANTQIREAFIKMAEQEDFNLHLPEKSLAGDNAFMIAIAGFLKYQREKKSTTSAIRARGNLSL